MSVLRQGKLARRRLRAILPYFTNLVAMEARQEGKVAASVAGLKFLGREAARLPRLAGIVASGRLRTPQRREPGADWPRILADLEALGLDIQHCTIDTAAFKEHIGSDRYPKNYAGGPVAKGGARERKLLEYFVSLDMLQVNRTDIVIDVASERSIFPEVLAALTGATVYQQDLIYPAGLKGRRIGGNAASMPLPDGFADKMVLHNAFEHFEGTADTEFIEEAWRLLKARGRLVIVPLFMRDRYCILTDPLAERKGIRWDDSAEVVEVLGWHNRFGRFYSVEALRSRVLQPALRLGFKPSIYDFVNVQEAHPAGTLRLGLLLEKP